MFLKTITHVHTHGWIENNNTYLVIPNPKSVKKKHFIFHIPNFHTPNKHNLAVETRQHVTVQRMSHCNSNEDG